MRLRNFLLFFCILSTTVLSAQIAFPDSAGVVNNNVKKASIYFKSWDGKRLLQKQLWYDNEGRIVREQEGENSFYYTYAYDKYGRRVCTTQRSKDGELIQKFTEEYSEINGTRKVCLYLQPDSTRIGYVYVYDKQGNKIREEQYNQGELSHLYTVQFDDKGNVLTSYDSTAFSRTVTIRSKGLLSRYRTYDPKGLLLHEYSYTYDAYSRIWKLSDSTGIMKTVHYEMVYGGQGRFVELIKRNEATMSEEEEAAFRKEHSYIFPVDNYDYQDYGLPVPEMITSHTFTFDKKGNIIRDDMVQRQGSASEAYIYEYEYEYY